MKPSEIVVALRERGWRDTHVVYSGGSCDYIAVPLPDLASVVWFGWGPDIEGDFHTIHSGPPQPRWIVNGCIYRVALPGVHHPNRRHQPEPGEFVRVAVVEDEVTIGADPIDAFDQFLRNAIAVPDDRFVSC
jgi:hypothetical protein